MSPLLYKDRGFLLCQGRVPLQCQGRVPFSLQCQGRGICCARAGTGSLLYCIMSGALCRREGALYCAREGSSALSGQSALSSAVPGQGDLLCQSKGLLLYYTKSGALCRTRAGSLCSAKAGSLCCAMAAGALCCAKAGSLCCVLKKDRSAVPWQGSSCSNFIFYKILY
jgi:hypothetical protein